MEKQTGYNLLYEVFGEEKGDEILDSSLRDLDDIKGISHVEEIYLGIDGWFASTKFQFMYEGKAYSVVEKSHTSDNICDSSVLWDKFKEEALPKTVFLKVFYKEDATQTFKELRDPNNCYDNMIAEDLKELVIDGDSLDKVSILEFEGTLDDYILAYLDGAKVQNKEGSHELILVKQ